MSTAGLYIHIPFCIQKCSYCDFFSVKVGSFENILSGINGSKFARRIVSDIDFFASEFGITEWDSVYVGGGTPSLLSPDDYTFIFSHILSRQKIAPKEFTIEINPEDLTKAHLDAACSSGVNRISVGVQSFCDDVLKTAHRRGSREKTISALSLIKNFSCVKLSCDLIAGLQGQTLQIIRDDLKTLLEFKPEHISFYSLCTEKELLENELDRIDSLWLYGKYFLEKNNYERYEVSNFSYKNLYPSLHNKKYWQLEDFVGVGPGAFGSIFSCTKSCIHKYMALIQKIDSDIITQKKQKFSALRFSANKNIEKWLESSNRDLVYSFELVTELEAIEEFMMMGLRLSTGINTKVFFDRFKITLYDLIPNTIDKWYDLKKLIQNANYLKLTDDESIFLNAFLVEAFFEVETSYKKFLAK